MAAKVTFNIDRCKGCELCTTVCPKHIVALDMNVTNRKGYHPATVTNMEECIGCASCAKICPDSIITVEKFSKLANNCILPNLTQDIFREMFPNILKHKVR